MPLQVTSAVLKLLQEEASRAHPAECCGILLGEGERVTRLVPAQNIHPSPHTHFEIDPRALIDAHREARAGGPQVVGYYHSHPHGPAHPSATDRRDAAHDGAIWALVSEQSDVTFWRDDESAFTPLPYQLADG